MLEQCAAERNIATATVIGGGYDNDHAELARRHSVIFDAAGAVLRGSEDAYTPTESGTK